MKSIGQLGTKLIIAGSVIVVGGLVLYLLSNTPPVIASVPDNFQVPPYEKNEEGELAEYGSRLIKDTYNLIGPGTQAAITGNNLTCSSCHLNGGTKPFAAPYVGLYTVFPTYIGRENKIESLQERINGCFERSMNGKAIHENSLEMRAIVSYIKHVSQGATDGKRLTGQGFIEFKTPKRAADLSQGEFIFQNKCALCHGAAGEGMKRLAENPDSDYLYPPLWGSGSYNDGAGMARVITAAKFIKGNMPLGVTYDKPMLSDDEAFDVAAFINSKSRPVKEHKELDYPDLSRKPKDCPYPPYQDTISIDQHKYGPFDFGKQ